jgi:hypothetical protein
MISLAVMKNYVLFKAGPAALDLIREEGLNPGRVKVFTGPAGGPKWFVSVGFDRGLMETGFLTRGGTRVLLAGSSAGAWRCIAMMCKDPRGAYEKLRIAYSRNVFTAADTPKTISAKLYDNVKAFLGPDDVTSILTHPWYDLAVHVVRSRGPAAADSVRVQGITLMVTALMNALSKSAMDLAFERVVFFAGQARPAFLQTKFNGRAIPLDERNTEFVALATGSLPYIVAGVKDIPSAPKGVYRDGGIVDYQLNQDYSPGEDGLTLFFHYQERIVPGWFDKLLTWRSPSPAVLERLLQVYPGPDFMKLLPDGRLPDREDFKTFLHNPEERIRRWDSVAELSSILWDEFIEQVESGRIRSLVQPLVSQ